MTFKNRDLLVVMTDLTPDCNLLGKPAFVDSEETILHNQRIGKINLLSENINPIFLYFILLSSPYLKKIKEQATGSTVRHTSNKSIYSISLPIPKTKEEQKAIAQTLSDVDALIASLDKLIAKKRNIKTGTMQQLLTGKTRLLGFGEGNGYKKSAIGLIPEDWDVVRLGFYVDINSGESPSKFALLDQGTPYFKVEQLNNDSKYLKTTPYYFRARKTIPAGSLIFPKRGASILLNKVRILAQDSFMDTNLMTLTTSNELENEYLYYFIDYAGLSKVADTTSIPQINNKHIVPFLIPFPNPKEQKAIAQVLSDIDTEITALEKRRAKTQAIKQGMMQELLTGRTRLKIEHPDDPITKNSNG